ncbi:hypothetical protein POV07_17390, partial [Enterobacter roggenkampii]
SVRHIFKPISYLEIQLLSGVSGGYIKIFDLPIDNGRDYYLCVRSDSEMTEDGKLLQNWLRRAAGHE